VPRIALAVSAAETPANQRPASSRAPAAEPGEQEREEVGGVADLPGRTVAAVAEGDRGVVVATQQRGLGESLPCRRETLELGHALGLVPATARPPHVVAALPEVAGQVEQEAARRLGVPREGGGPIQPERARSGASADRVEQAALADTGLAGDQQQMPAAV
jgi:hypothetical protein